MTTNKSIVPALPRGFVKIEPDDDRFKNKFHVNSASSDRVYRISYDAAPGAGWWMCSCRGCIGHGHCKHLKAIGLYPTRQDILQKRIGQTANSGYTDPGPKPRARPGPRRLGGGR